MKTMSIIGIVWFSLSFICIAALSRFDVRAAAGWGILGMLYAIPYSIVGLVKSNKKSDKEMNMTQKLIELSELKGKGLLSEDEFYAQKTDLLKIYFNP